MSKRWYVKQSYWNGKARHDRGSAGKFTVVADISSDTDRANDTPATSDIQI